MKPASLVALALVLVLAIPATASADFRTDNTWVATPKAAAALMASQRYSFTGGELGPGHWTVRRAFCRGDLDSRYARNSRGFYHHLFCAAVLVGVTKYVATFQYWAIGATNYRITNISYVSG